MLQSMTGFGKGEVQTENLRVTTEIKSVNNRFKDFRFKMSSIFNPIESEFKNKLLDVFTRGSFEISINYKRIVKENHSFRIDQEKINDFISQLTAIDSLGSVNLEYKAVDFLRPEFQKEVDQDEFLSELVPLVNQSFDEALLHLKKFREDEGQKISNSLLFYLKSYKEDLSVVLENKEKYREDLEKKLRERLDQLPELKNIDDQRLLQEVIFYLEKLDINEEVDRINYHLDSLSKLLSSSNKEVGRKLDFLVQELNRETNTIGSKSGSKKISNSVVNMKSFLEKVREQGLNLQ